MGFTKRNARPVAGPGVLGDDQPARKINSRNKLNGRRPQQVSPKETAEERQRLLLAELSAWIKIWIGSLPALPVTRK